MAEVRAAVDMLRAEVEGMRKEMLTGVVTIAGNTGRVARVLTDITTATGAEAIATIAVSL